MPTDGPIERRARTRLLRTLQGRGISAPVCAAMEALPRHWFLPPDARAQAYCDAPIPIGAEQTISQPSLVGHMLDLLELRPGARVLDVGAGSGWVTALLARLIGPSGAVYARERQGRLARRTSRLLHELSQEAWAPVHLEHADAAAGWPEQAPFAAIHVGAAFPTATSLLEEQLDLGGRLIQPVTRAGDQELQLVIRHRDGHLERRADCAVRFVPVLPAIVE